MATSHQPEAGRERPNIPYLQYHYQLILTNIYTFSSQDISVYMHMRMCVWTSADLTKAGPVPYAQCVALTCRLVID